MMKRVLPKVPRTASEFQKGQVALNWIWKIVQRQASCQSVAEEIGNSPDLQDLLNAASHGRLALRSRALVVLGIKKGISARKLSNLLCLSRKTVTNYWLDYCQNGWRSSMASQKKISAKIDKPHNKQAVFMLLHSPPSLHGFNRTTWRMDDLQSALRRQGHSMCKDVIRTIIKAAGFRWRKARVVLTSRDPDYREKVDAIRSILSGLTPDEAFFSIDEFGPFAVKCKGGMKRVAPGEDYVVQQWQKSKGWMILTAALELSRNQVTHFYSLKKNTDEMIRMADLLKTQYQQCETLYLSWDAASWHISKKLIAHLDKINQQAAKDGGPIVKTAPLPAGAQFLNIIESVFSGMAKAIIHNSDYPSVEVAKCAIDRYFVERNEQFVRHPKRAGDKIWRQERVTSEFREDQNCKDPLY
jgi:transposase